MPSNPTLNYLHSNRATLSIDSLPNVSFQLTEFPIPGVELPPAMHPHPFRNEPIAGDKINFQPLNVTFNVDENLENWLEAFTWMLELGAPANKEAQYNRSRSSADAQLITYSAKNNPVLQLSFLHCIPTSLGQIDFTEEDSETIYKKSTLELEYSRFEITKL